MNTPYDWELEAPEDFQSLPESARTNFCARPMSIRLAIISTISAGVGFVASYLGPEGQSLSGLSHKTAGDLAAAAAIAKLLELAGSSSDSRDEQEVQSEPSEHKA